MLMLASGDMGCFLIKYMINYIIYNYIYIYVFYIIYYIMYSFYDHYILNQGRFVNTDQLQNLNH